jgi:hypothetical protein
MEQRLKDDVLAEAARYGGRILVQRESAPSSTASAGGALPSTQPSGRGEVVDCWEAVSGPHAVQTPAEVYAALAEEGLGVRYVRVPVTDGRAPSPEDIDTMRSAVLEAGPSMPIVANCQLGAGRTTTAMVIAGMLRMLAQQGGDGSVGAAAAALVTASVDAERLQQELAGNSPKSGARRGCGGAALRAGLGLALGPCAAWAWGLGAGGPPRGPGQH